MFSDALASVCEHVREGGPENAVGGVVPQVVATPANVDELSAVVAATHRAGRSLVVAGRGTCLQMGNPPARLDVLVSTARLCGVVEHRPDDLVLTVRAGTPLSVVQDQLAHHRQRIALDPEHDGSLGGIISANGSGPLRHRYGTVRDQLLGATFVLADGTVARAGGKVVKNVAGYDLCKLLTGSFGTLAVVVEATLRVYPVPRAAAVLRHPVSSVDDVLNLVTRYRRSRIEPSAMELAFDLGTRTGWIDTLIEGTDSGVSRRAEVVGPGLPVDPVTVPDTAFVLAVCVPPGAVGALLAGLEGAGFVRGRVALGVLYLHTDDDVVDAVRAVAALLDGSVVVRRGPTADPWGPVRGLDLMRRIKKQFDPTGTLAPGRFVGGI